MATGSKSDAARGDGVVEESVRATARRLAAASLEKRRSPGTWWTDQMVDWTVSHPSFRTQLFRFVDVFAATEDDDEEVVRHLREYIGHGDAPRVVDLAVAVAERVPFGGKVSAAVARRSIERLATHFIAGRSIAEAIPPLRELWAQGQGFVIDLLGEHTLCERDADRYASRVHELLIAVAAAVKDWPASPQLDRDAHGPLARAHISIKPSAFASSYGPLTRADGLRQASRRLEPLLELASRSGVFVWFDMESYDVKDVTFELFRDLVGQPRLAGLQAGIVVQAYLKDSAADLVDLLAWAQQRSEPVGVRLVKGAYWDAEVIKARAAGWPVPVFEDKSETDSNFERCTRLLLDHHETVRPAFGTHNLRSIAYAIEYAKARGVPAGSVEIQLLYGMASSLQHAVSSVGTRARIYVPVGELLEGMAYLVRRLLENTANESVVRSHRLDERTVEQLLVAPKPTARRGRRATPADASTDSRAPHPYRPEPTREWRRSEVRRSFSATVSRDGGGARSVPARIAGEAVHTEAKIVSVDPSSPGHVVARSAACESWHVDAAVEAASRAWPAWRRTPVAERAAVLFRAASWMRTRRDELSVLEVVEAGKPWAEADADVCEAIDFCEYYGREMLRLDHGGTVSSPPGEHNELRYRPRGVGAVIAPWNFPLAIPTGMVIAALVTGNAVVLKPAEQTPAIAASLVEALTAAGLPPAVLAFLPGYGEIVGAALIAHPAISYIAFTGSRPVGLEIIERAARQTGEKRHVTRVIAEMGGKNALIVDNDADIDVAIPAIVSSAFGYAGQKCSAASRLIVLRDIADNVVDRLVEATRALRIGSPREMATQIGPLIEMSARERVLAYADAARQEGTVLLQREDLPADGYFAGPTVVADLPPGSKVLTDEIFGPLLAVQRADDLDQALELANDTAFALTGGIISRTPSHIRRVTEELRAGNIYVNRSITGAVVGRHPFGGFGLSGVGSKAGGPDYLLQFLEPRTITENLVRQGFSPDDES